MEDFYSLGLPEALLVRLQAMQYKAPTPIQAQTIPHAIQGMDVLGTAQTGTGKTAAYVIPVVCHLFDKQDKSALILTPTREIAIQVSGFLNNLLDRKSGIKTALIIGGDSMSAQMNQLRMKPRIIVGTPGRVNDHLDRGSLKLDNTEFVVLDETDRMLDMGFSIQLEEIFKFLPAKRQTLMFSATLPQNIMKIANQYLNDPVRISIGSTIAAADTITQEVIHTSEDNKYTVLLEQLEIREGSVIIFVKTKFSTEKLANRLRENGHMVDAIHGDLRQRNREKVMRYFRNKKNRILVATDIAARGLDIAHVECVINHDLPQCEEDFIHRIGRTGRAGMEGVAVSLVTPQDHIKWRNINKMMNPNAKIDLPMDERGAPKRRSRNNSERFKKSSRNEFPSRSRTFGERDQPRNSEGRFRSSANKSSRDNQEFGNNSRSENKFRKSEGSKFERSSSRPPRSSNEFSFGSRSENKFGKSEGGKFERSSNRSPRSSNEFSFSSRSENKFERSEGVKFERSSSRSPRSPNKFGSDSRSENKFGRSEGSKFGGSSSRSPRSSNEFNSGSRSENKFGRSEGGKFERSSSRSPRSSNKFNSDSSRPNNRFAKTSIGKPSNGFKKA